MTLQRMVEMCVLGAAGLAAAALVMAMAAGPLFAAAAAQKPAGDKAVLVDADNNFAMDLYGRLQAKPGNLFFSPESIATALAMTSAGARGDTATQMAAVLHLPADRMAKPEWLHAANAALMADLKGDGKPRAYELAIANALWGQKGYAFLPDFLGLLKTSYGAGLEEVDFVRDAEGSRKTINAWVEKETRDKIKDLIPAGVLDGLTRLVLTNAIYFKGDWVKPFQKDATGDQDFFVAAGRKVKAPMMSQIGNFKYLDEADVKVLEMPYGGNELAMVVLLPKKVDGLAELEKGLTAEKVAGWIGRLRERHDVEVAMPKFKITAEFMLKDALAAMGMALAFDPDKADFSGMNGGKEKLFISAVIHKAFVDVNEKGTEAAAATGVVVSATMAPLNPPVFRADHPFIFLIRDVKSGLATASPWRAGGILFMGRLADPRT